MRLRALWLVTAWLAPAPCIAQVARNACTPCHARTIERQPASKFTHGRCESCHKPDEGEGPRSALPASHLPVRSLKGRFATEVSDICGTCHGAMMSGKPDNDFTLAANTVRMPLYLAQSECFQDGDSGLSCITCHTPHEAGKGRPPEFYNRICRSCHAPGKAGLPAATCQDNCIRCHMPQVDAGKGRLLLNHWIGIYAPGKPLMPAK